MKKNNIVGLNILSIIGVFLILLGLDALSYNIVMKETTGEIIHCSKVYSSNGGYWDTSAKFSVDGKEYYGDVNVNSHKYSGEKIKILYDPQNPNHFISKSSTYSGFTMIIFGFVFLIPKIQNIRKTSDKIVQL